MIEITFDNVLTLLEQAIEANGGPDTTYPARFDRMVGMEHAYDDLGGECYYVTPKLVEDYDEDCGGKRWMGVDPDLDAELTPSCVIGCVWAAAGAPLRFFVEQTANNSAISEERLLRDAAVKAEVVIEPDAAAVLRSAQASQDRGDTWGTALKKARNTHLEITLRRAARAASATSEESKA